MAAESVNHTELVIRLQRGEPGAFDEALSLFQGPVYSMLLRGVRDRDDALELAQEVFLRVHVGIAGFTPGGSFRAWIYRIATNLLRDHLRSLPARRRREQLPVMEELLPDSSGKTDRFFSKEAVLQVEDALGRLSERYREVFSLYYFQGLTVAEVSVALDLGQSNVKVLLHRARAALLKDRKIRALKEVFYE